MSETNTTVTAPETTPETNGSESNGHVRAAHKGVFPTIEAAKAVTPPSDKFRLYAVSSKSGDVVYTWGNSVKTAIDNAAREAGYSAEVAEPKEGGVTKDRIASKLAEFTDEELADLGLARKKTRAPKTPKE